MTPVPPNAKDKTNTELATWLEGLSSGDRVYHTEYPNFREAAQRLRTQSQRLRDLEAKLEAARWQPIETAPKDGRWVITFDGEDVHPNYWIGWEEIEHWAKTPLLIMPVCWMPLPEPPIQAKGEA